MTNSSQKKHTGKILSIILTPFQGFAPAAVVSRIAMVLHCLSILKKDSTGYSRASHARSSPQRGRAGAKGGAIS